MCPLVITATLLAAAPSTGPGPAPRSNKTDVERAFAALQERTRAGLPHVENQDEVKALFREMFDVDQGVRRLEPMDVELLRKVDAHTRSILQSYLERMDWFRISVWGDEMDNKAWIIAQHADNDVAFQQEVLARLEKLVPLKETSGSSFGYLWDRVAVNTGKKQRYGTQGMCTGPGKWEARELEDPARVDALRREVGIAERMGTLAEYTAKMNAHCK